MYFPKDMTFQYFFFDTYIGYFLQALPFALVVSIIYGIIKFKNKKDIPVGKKIFSCVFVGYITGLICLVVCLDLMHIFWYNLFYSMDSSVTINWFGGEIDLIFDFFANISGEVLGNFLMFLPFGILYPLSKDDVTFKEIVIKGVLFVIFIELLQPIFNRMLDINDIVLDSFGIVLSAIIYISIRKIKDMF